MSYRRGNLGGLHTKASPEETRWDIDETFRKWGIDEYRIPRDSRGEQGDARIVFYVNDQQQELRCSRFQHYRENLRALYLILEALRKAQERGIMEELARAAVAMLPPGNQKRPAHEVLQVAEFTPLDVAEAAYRTLAKSRHPDSGGTNEAMTALNAAIEEFRQRTQT